MLLRKDLIRIGLKGNTSEEVERNFAAVFVEAGVGKPNYPDAIVEREKEYPTGLPAAAFDIAIPHTYAEYVNEEAMGIAILEQPVEFKQMGSPEITLYPQILFMLAIINPKNQIKTLQNIVKIVQSGDLLQQVKNAKTAEEVFDILEPALKIEGDGENEKGLNKGH